MAYWPKKGKKKYYNNRPSGNPFFNRPKPRSRLTLKAKLTSLSIAAILGFLVWLIFISGIFSIINIEVEGQTEELKNVILEKSWNQTGRPRFAIFKQTNLWAFSKGELIADLNKDYAFSELKIKKRPFHKLKISFVEKKSSFAWKEGDKYYYADASGAIIKEVDPLNINAENSYLIENQDSPRAEDKSLAEDINRINYIRQLFDSVGNNRDGIYKIEKFILDNDLRTVKMALSAGPVIQFNTEVEPEVQLSRLTTLINEKLKDDYKKKKYIDLRFGELIYYQ